MWCIYTTSCNHTSKFARIDMKKCDVILHIFQGCASKRYMWVTALLCPYSVKNNEFINFWRYTEISLQMYSRIRNLQGIQSLKNSYIKSFIMSSHFPQQASCCDVYAFIVGTMKKRTKLQREYCVLLFGDNMFLHLITELLREWESGPCKTDKPHQLCWCRYSNWPS